MQFFTGYILTATLALVALAFPSVCLADDEIPRTTAQQNYRDPIPATCQQFEALFPKAIKHPEQEYYTLSINGSSAVFFYNNYDEITLGFIITQAKRNAAKLAQILHLHYNEGLTERGKTYHNAFLYNDRALFRDLSIETITSTEQESSANAELKPPYTLINLFAALVKSKEFEFYDWNRRGITFVSKKYNQKKIVFSAHRARSLIVHFYFDNIYTHANRLYAPINRFEDILRPQSRETKKMLRISELERIISHHPGTNLVYGVNKNGTYVLGKLERKNPLNSIPASAPKAFPKERSYWPTVTLATLQQKESKTNKDAAATGLSPSVIQPHTPPLPKAESKQGKIHLPLTPGEALKAYLKHIQSL